MHQGTALFLHPAIQGGRGRSVPHSTKSSSACISFATLQRREPKHHSQPSISQQLHGGVHETARVSKSNGGDESGGRGAREGPGGASAAASHRKAQPSSLPHVRCRPSGAHLAWMKLSLLSPTPPPCHTQMPPPLPARCGRVHEQCQVMGPLMSGGMR